MKTHVWRQSGFIVAGYAEGSNFLSPLQEYKCEVCGEVITLPDCRKTFCQTMMSLGCLGERKRIALRPKEKSPYEEKKTYPAKKRKRR